MSDSKVVLKNGAEEPLDIVTKTVETLTFLRGEYPIALWELLMKCRDSDFRFWGSTGAVLARYGLVEPGDVVTATIRNIVLSAVEADEIKLTVGAAIRD